MSDVFKFARKNYSDFLEIRDHIDIFLEFLEYLEPEGREKAQAHDGLWIKWLQEADRRRSELAKLGGDWLLSFIDDEYIKNIASNVPIEIARTAARLAADEEALGWANMVREPYCVDDKALGQKVCLTDLNLWLNDTDKFDWALPAAVYKTEVNNWVGYEVRENYFSESSGYYAAGLAWILDAEPDVRDEVVARLRTIGVNVRDDNSINPEELLQAMSRIPRLQ